MTTNITDKMNEKYKNLSEIYDSITAQGYSPGDMIEFIHKKRFLSIMSLLTSKWFTIRLFNYLITTEIVKLDESICVREFRNEWLECLKDCTISRKILLQHSSMQQKANWLNLRNVQILDLWFNFGNAETLQITDPSVYLLSKNNPNMKRITISGCHTRSCVGDLFFDHIANFCCKLQSLEITSQYLPVGTRSFATLARSCHQLKSIIINESSSPSSEGNFSFDDHTYDIGQLLTNNNSLESFTSDFPLSPAHILTVLGNNCNQLTTLDLTNFHGENLNGPCLEIFTQGCPHLKSLTFDHPGIHCNVLFDCLGKYNPQLQVLNCESKDIPDELKKANNASLECFAKGCPLLRELKFYFIKVPLEGLKALVKYCVGKTDEHNTTYTNIYILTAYIICYLYIFVRHRKIRISRR